MKPAIPNQSTFMKSALFIVIAAAPLATLSHAAATFTNTFHVSTAIPDNNDTGYVSRQTIEPGSGGNPAAPEISFITGVTVDLTFTGGWNGDLYVYLIHQTGYSVLLNRIGRSAANPDGNANPGMTITVADEASTDVHQSGSGNSTLTGAYQPDGRTTDPDSVLPTDPRTAFLSSFNGLDAAGEWTLFVADLGAGGQSTLESWSLTITATVPEPSTGILLLGASSLAVSRRRR